MEIEKFSYLKKRLHWAETKTGAGPTKYRKRALGFLTMGQGPLGGEVDRLDLGRGAALAHVGWSCVCSHAHASVGSSGDGAGRRRRQRGDGDWRVRARGPRGAGSSTGTNNLVAPSPFPAAKASSRPASLAVEACCEGERDPVRGGEENGKGMRGRRGRHWPAAEVTDASRLRRACRRRGHGAAG